MNIRVFFKFLVLISFALCTQLVPSIANAQEDEHPQRSSAQVDAQRTVADQQTATAVAEDRPKQQAACNLSGDWQALANSCSDCARQAQECCSNPEACSEKMGLGAKAQAFLQQAPAYMALASAIGGESMGQMQCYAQALGALSSMFPAKTVSQRCKEWREGFQGTPGCTRTCSTAYNAILAQRDSSLAPLLSQMQELANTCGQETQKGEQETGQQALQLAQQAQQAQACMDGFGDDSFAGEEMVDCSKPEYSGHYKCQRIDEKTGLGGDLDSTLADLSDSSLLDDGDPFAPTDPTSFKGGDSQAGGAPVGGFGGPGGGGLPPGGPRGPAATDGNKKGGIAAKAKNLIGGYRNANSTGAGGSKKKGKKFSFKQFKLDKKKKEDDKGNLSALTALAKAGIFPQSEGGFIFERITNRFSATCNPKAFYDCTRNQISWYEQVKFKRNKR